MTNPGHPGGKTVDHTNPHRGRRPRPGNNASNLTHSTCRWSRFLLPPFEISGAHHRDRRAADHDRLRAATSRRAACSSRSPARLYIAMQGKRQSGPSQAITAWSPPQLQRSSCLVHGRSARRDSLPFPPATGPPFRPSISADGAPCHSPNSRHRPLVPSAKPVLYHRSRRYRERRLTLATTRCLLCLLDLPCLTSLLYQVCAV